MATCLESNIDWAEKTFGTESEEYGRALNNPSYCMLPDGHEGPHEFVPGSEIVICQFEEGAECS